MSVVNHHFLQPAEICDVLPCISEKLRYVTEIATSVFPIHIEKLQETKSRFEISIMVMKFNRNFRFKLSQNSFLASIPN